MTRVEGKAGISATIIADSVSSVNGKRITTFELIYPRFIHAELMTHRQFSRNSASSRAIPVKRMIELIREKMATFVHWGKNQAGMQAKEEHNELVSKYMIVDHIKYTREEAWLLAAKDAIRHAEEFNRAGYHKQIVNRLLEPFQMMKVVCTATEFDNFFWLRCHADAQPEIQELANCMYEAYQKSKPETLYPGEWHTPYVEHERTEDGLKYINYQDGWGYYISAEKAIKISCSCCAQVSYRKLDDSLEKAIELYDRLVTSQPVHASALEHVATPMEMPQARDPVNECYDGATHIDRKGNVWSGNFQSWIQYRQMIPNHVCNEFTKEVK